MELIDGSDTDWTHRLPNNAKERLVASGIGSERLCQEFMLVTRSSTQAYVRRPKAYRVESGEASFPSLFFSTGC